MTAEHFLHRYYKLGTNPFKSISELSDDDKIQFMKENFPDHGWFHANPEKRISTRRTVENWLFDAFVRSGGEPKTHHPCYFTLGKSAFLRDEGFYDAEIQIPLHLFSSKNVNFTYPDSFFSHWLNHNRDHKCYNGELNGKLFTIDEILSLLNENKIPAHVRMDAYYEFEFYIEAQVWDYDIFRHYKAG